MSDEDVDEYTLRMSLNKGVDWFIRPMRLESGGDMEFDAMNEPADSWPCNRDKARRDFGGGKGESNWTRGEKYSR